ncbi:hypothetical protein BsWGS_10342 [Bradybaena similaris]
MIFLATDISSRLPSLSDRIDNTHTIVTLRRRRPAFQMACPCTATPNVSMVKPRSPFFPATLSTRCLVHTLKENSSLNTLLPKQNFQMRKSTHTKTHLYHL